MGRPREPVGEYKAEAGMLKQGNETCSKAAWEFAVANRGVIITGGGSRFITFRPTVDGLRQVELLKHTKVTSGGMLKTFAVRVRYVESHPVSEVDDPSDTRFCPDCGDYIFPDNLREDGAHPEVGWEYYECSECNARFRQGQAEVRNTETEQFDTYSEGKSQFMELVPDSETRKTVSLGIPGYESPPFEKQAQMHDVTVPESLP